MSWEDQGRQAHGRFGNGTGGGGEADAVDAVLERASSLVGGRGGAAFRAYLGDDGAAELQEALPIWAGASGLDAGSFRRLVVGSALGEQAAAGLQEVGRQLAAGEVDAAGAALAEVVASEPAAQLRYRLVYARDQAVYSSVNGALPDKPIVTAQLIPFLATSNPFVFTRPPIAPVLRPSPRLAPHPDAEGPHTVIRRNPDTGEVTKYEEFRPQTNPLDPKPFESVKRFDRYGNGHYNKATGEKVPEPHIHEPTTPGGVREALPTEIPK